MTAVSRRPSIIVVARFVVKYLARRAGGIGVSHGEKVGIAARRQQAIVELDLGVGKGDRWYFVRRDAGLGWRLLEFTLH